MMITSNRCHKITFLGNDNSDFCYVPILKNAHEWGTMFFRQTANFSVTENFREKRYIVFFRNPITRWYSGVAQWFASNLIGSDYKIDPLMLKLIFTSVRLDPHCDLQVDLLNGLNFNKCIFFDCDDENFEFNLYHFTQHLMQLEVPKKRIAKINDSSKNVLKTSIINQLKNEVTKKPKILRTVEEYYLPDMNLLRNIQFYEPRLKNKFIY